MNGITALIFRAEKDCYIGMEGNLMRLSAGVPAVYPAADDSLNCFTVWGDPRFLAEGRFTAPEAHFVRLEGGSAREASLPVTDWGRALEIEVNPAEAALPFRGEPRILAETAWTAGGGKVKAELYSDAGLRLAITREGRPAETYPLCDGTGGGVNTVDLGFGKLLSVTAVTETGERLFLLNSGLERIFEAEGFRAMISEGVPTVIERLGTVRGHEKRTAYEFRGGAFEALEPEIGFFTHEPNTLESERLMAAAAAEEARMGLPSQRENLSEELSAMLGENGLSEFLGEYGSVLTYPVEEAAGLVTVGLLGEREGNIARPRKYLFTFRNGLIDDVEEL
jgi:hypothetical protein